MFMCTWVRSEQAMGGETISEEEHLMAQRVCMYDRSVCFLNILGWALTQPTQEFRPGISLLIPLPLSRTLFQG